MLLYSGPDLDGPKPSVFPGGRILMTTSLLTSATEIDEVSFPDAPDEIVVKIRPHAGTWRLDLPTLWRFRSMVYLLVWRDFKVKYKQSALGALWIILQPFGNVFLYSFIFGSLARMPSDEVPYALFNYVGLLPWLLFATCLPSVSGSLVSNTH